MQDRPSAAELLDALAGMLFGDVREWVPRERRFQVLVAANVCAVVARELRAGAEPSVADVRLFRELLGAGDLTKQRRPARAEADRSMGTVEWIDESKDVQAAARLCAGELAAAIRCGELDERLDEVGWRLREHVARKLEIARPGYGESPPQG